jgi:hypothetical protein
MLDADAAPPSFDFCGFLKKENHSGGKRKTIHSMTYAGEKTNGGQATRVQLKLPEYYCRLLIGAVEYAT